MKHLIPMIVQELAQGRSLALATVLQAVGSAPRGAGACQIRLENGKDFGTVGGGMIEHRTLQELALLLQQPHREQDLTAKGIAYTNPDSIGFAISCPVTSPSTVAEYALTQNEILSLGMVCGGTVRVLYQLLTPSILPFFAALADRIRSGKENLWLVRSLREGRVTSMAAVEHGEALAAIHPGCAVAPLPRRASMQMHAAAQDADYFIEPIQLASHTYIFGCGHVAQCVAPLLAQLDFSPIVYDDRPEFANAERFPTVSQILCAPYQEASEHLCITPEDEIVIMTRGHVNDLLTLSFALRTPAYYIGLIGSRSKIAHTREMILAQGFSQEQFARVHTPIGMPILAETPMEIAVSVAGEMIRCRAEHAMGAKLPSFDTGEKH
ncbi:MAG: XdhC family protein [Candidatus Limiplasma sp.]|nr:XdhC family protein [Candidatus Limiplasma sp.]